MKKILLLLLLSFNLTAFSEEEYKFEGMHLLASYGDCDPVALKNISELKKAFLTAIEKSGATILHFQDQIFLPHGFTMLVLLSESHASIHTYPEHNACFIDLFTCGDHCSSQEFGKAIEEYLKPKKTTKKLFARSSSVEEIE